MVGRMIKNPQGFISILIKFDQICYYSLGNSDHHAKPDREYPLLQKYDNNEAPQLPFGYPLMIAICLIPTLWRRVMNPRVDT